MILILSLFLHYFAAIGANGLQGSIPSELAYLDQVAYVNFDKNSIKGTLPSELANLRNLGKF